MSEALYCNIAALDRVSALLAGTATRNQIREHRVMCLEAEVAEQINADIQLVTEPDDHGDFRHVGYPVVEIILEDDDVSAWDIEQPVFFHGDKDGCCWDAEMVGKPKRHQQKLMFRVQVSPA